MAIDFVKSDKKQNSKTKAEKCSADEDKAIGEYTKIK